VRPT